MKKKTLTIAIALVLVVALAVGATYAYLTATTDKVTNTFSAGKVINDPENNFLLKEHEVAYDNASGTYKYVDQQGAFVEDGTVVTDGNKYEQIAPKTTAPKDPFIKFTANIESPAYLFVKVTDTTTGITANVDTTKWTELKGDDLKLGEHEKLYVYKDIITVGTHPDPYYILANNQITASATEAISGGLVFNGYLCQAAGFHSATEAFNQCFGTTTGA